MSWRRWLAPVALLLLIVLGGGLGFFAYTRLALGLHLRQQAVLLGLPASISAEVRTLSPARVGLQGEVSARIPLRQTFMVPLRGSYEADVAFDAEVPLKTVIHYRGTVPVATTASLAGSTGLVLDKSWLPKFPLRAQVPLRFDIPVNLAVPVDTRIRLAYRGPLRFSLDQRLAVPVDTVLRSRFPLAREAEAPVRTAFRLRAVPPASVPVIIEDAKLELPLAGVRLQRSVATD